MSKQSGFLKRQKEDIDYYSKQAQVMMQQFMIDTLQITLGDDKWGFGFKRLMELAEDWKKTRHELYPALDPTHPECDVAREHMDRFFREKCKGKGQIIPSEERYCMIKQVSYGGRRK